MPKLKHIPFDQLLNRMQLVAHITAGISATVLFFCAYQMWS